MLKFWGCVSSMKYILNKYRSNTIKYQESFEYTITWPIHTPFSICEHPTVGETTIFYRELRLHPLYKSVVSHNYNYLCWKVLLRTVSIEISQFLTTFKIQIFSSDLICIQSWVKKYSYTFIHNHAYDQNIQLMLTYVFNYYFV